MKRLISNGNGAFKIDIEKADFFIENDSIRMTINVKFPIWMTNESIFDIADFENFIKQHIKIELSRIVEKGLK